MIVLDTDTLSHLLAGHPRVSARRRATDDEVVITIITRIETLQGRFSTIVTASDGTELQRGQEQVR